MPKLTIALLSGGASSEREVSLSSGNQVFNALDTAKYDIKRYDPSCDLPRLVADAPQIDFALIILHGPYGEDGTVQGLLDLLGIPYQGSGVLGSALAMNKLVAKRLYQQANLPVPAYQVLQRDIPLPVEAIVAQLGLPVVVKPVEGGSSIGMSIVPSADKLRGALEKAFAYGPTVLVEAYIAGLELTVGVLGNRQPQALPVIEIIPNSGYEFFDYEAKYKAGATKEICPARIDAALRAKAQQIAIGAHQALFCRGCSRSDMILCGQELFLLETNTIPGMTQTSLLPLAASTAGIGFSQLLDRLIELGLEARRAA